MAILAESHNCRCKCLANKVTFLVDGAAYFEAVADMIDRAQETILIAAWDIDSRMKLLPEKGPDTHPQDLGHLLNSKAKQTPGLRVYILNWDFPMLYLREREWLPIFNLGWKTHHRIFYHLDDQHPIGASQHQKFVVIDNQVAFCGGLDLTNSRWDTPQHRLNEPRRTNPDGDPYDPFHDIQMMVNGEAAESLSQLFMDRWKRATGDSIDLTGNDSADLWPKNLTPDLENVEVAISLTLPAYKGREEVREVERLYKAAIASARESVYIENQYLTSIEIAGALEGSLSREQGPEIVIILPRKSSGWLEQSTMDALRSRILKRLEEADGHHRFRVFYPCLDDGGTALYVHSKLMIVDDRLLIIGSANLSNRSMGLDSECNLAIEANDGDKTSAAIISLRNRLLAEHLGSSPDRISEALSGERRVIPLVDSFISSGRGLKDLEYQESVPIDAAAMVEDPQLLDPEAPIEFDRMMDRFVRFDTRQNRIQPVVTITGALIILFLLAATWYWTPVSDWVDPEYLTRWADRIRSHPMSFPITLAAYVAAGFLMVPVILLVGVTALVFGPFWGGAYAWGGCLVSALVGFWAGSVLGKRPVRKLAGRHLNRMSRRMSSQGLLAVVMLRNVPVAPFGLVNLIAGASKMKFKNYLFGTALGTLPGVVLISILADRLVYAIKNPSWINSLIPAVLLAVLVVGNWWMTKRLTKR